MFNITPERIDDVDLQELLDEYSELPSIIGEARGMLTDVFSAKDNTNEFIQRVAAVDFLLGGCEMYLRYIERALMKYYWFEERVKKGQPTD